MVNSTHRPWEMFTETHFMWFSKVEWNPVILSGLSKYLLCFSGRQIWQISAEDRCLSSFRGTSKETQKLGSRPKVTRPGDTGQKLEGRAASGDREGNLEPLSSYGTESIDNLGQK